MLNLIYSILNINIEKTEEPRLRPGSVCAVGWEPNPAHTPALVKLEEAYKKCGWKVAGGQNCIFYMI